MASVVTAFATSVIASKKQTDLGNNREPLDMPDLFAMTLFKFPLSVVTGKEWVKGRN